MNHCFPKKMNVFVFEIFQEPTPPRSLRKESCTVGGSVAASATTACMQRTNQNDWGTTRLSPGRNSSTSGKAVQHASGQLLAGECGQDVGKKKNSFLLIRKFFYFYLTLVLFFFSSFFFSFSFSDRFIWQLWRGVHVGRHSTRCRVELGEMGQWSIGARVREVLYMLVVLVV